MSKKRGDLTSTSGSSRGGVGSQTPPRRQQDCPPGNLIIQLRSSDPLVNLSYVTVNVPALFAVPPGVVTLILPVFAAVGTFAVICV